MSSDAERPREEPVLTAEDRPGPPPLMAEDPVETPAAKSGRGLSAFLALFVLFIFAGIVWYAYDQGRREGSEAVAPLIRADASPIKVKPEKPGGLQVPHRDKLIFDNLRRRGDGDSSKIERLLPPPENPLPPPKVPQPSSLADGSDSATAIPPARAPSGSSTRKVESLVAPANQPKEPPAPKVVARVTPKPAPAPKPAATTAPRRLTPKVTAPPPVPKTAAKVPVPKAPVAPKPAAKAPIVRAPAAPPKTAPTAAAPAPAALATPVNTTANGRFVIQIAALRSAVAAQREWARAQKAHPAQLGGLSLQVQRIDLGSGKGVFHRVRAGPLNEAGARQVCAALAAARQACIVARQ